MQNKYFSTLCHGADDGKLAFLVLAKKERIKVESLAYTMTLYVYITLYVVVV